MGSINKEAIQETFRLFGVLEDTSSTMEKKFIIATGKSNDAFTALLYRTYNPYTMYNIKNIEIDIGTVYEDTDLVNDYICFMGLLEDLSQKRITGNAAIIRTKGLFSVMNSEERFWYLRVLKKDLNVGIKAKTINEIIPGLIPTFGVQLAEEHDGRLPNGVILIQPKLDGYRAVGSTTTGELFSRNGKLIEGYTEIEQQLLLMPKGLMLDGEILALGSFKGTQETAFRHSTGKEGFLNVFDVMSPEDNKITNMTQLERNRLLANDLMPEHREDIPNLQRLKGWYVTSNNNRERRMTEILEHYNTCLKLGYEGIMIKDGDAKYETKRGYNWQKLKPVKSIDLKVIGIELGNMDTKYSECVGRLVCDFLGEEVRVGSGLSDSQREEWWMYPERIVGKTIEVLYQEFSTNQKDGKSLRFPRYKCLRPDLD